MKPYLYSTAKKICMTSLSIVTHPIGIFGLVVCSTGFIHWALVQIYATYCAFWGFWGPLNTLITLGSPTCQFINVAQVELAKHYITIWVGAAASLVTWIATTLKA